MIAAGYMAKRVANKPNWLQAKNVRDIYSVSSCVSEHFTDYVNYWKHNGYWLFDSPAPIKLLARQICLDIADTELFYYEAYEFQFNEKALAWESFGPEPSLPLNVCPPNAARLEGFDVVSFFAGNCPECSPLSCNGLATEIDTNRHCLLSSFEEAKALLEDGKFVNCEPGPYRVFAVYSADWP